MPPDTQVEYAIHSVFHFTHTYVKQPECPPNTVMLETALVHKYVHKLLSKGTDSGFSERLVKL